MLRWSVPPNAQLRTNSDGAAGTRASWPRGRSSLAASPARYDQFPEQFDFSGLTYYRCCSVVAMSWPSRLLTAAVSRSTILRALGAWPCTEEVSPTPRIDSLQLLTNLCLAIFGPAATAWYGILQRHVVLKSTTTTTVARVAADQVVFAPVNLTVFLSSMAIMEGSDPVERWRQAFIPTYKANLMVWPLIQGANFTLVPLELRVLVVNVVSLGGFCSRSCLVEAMHVLMLIGWNCFLSMMNSGEE